MLSFSTGVLQGTGPITMNGGILQWSNLEGANSNDVSGQLVMVNGIAATLDLNGNSVIFANGIGNGSTASLVLVGSGSLTLLGTSTYTGGTTVSAGTLQLGNNSALGSGGLTANAGFVDLAANSPTISSLSGAAGTITNSGTVDSTLTVNQSTTTTFSGTLADGPTNRVALAIAGPGTLVLAGSNTYSGATTLTAGVLAAGAANALSPNSGVVVNGGTLDATAFPQIVGSLAVGPSGALNLSIGNLFTNTGLAILGGTLNLFGVAGGGTEELISYPSYSGSFAAATGIAAGYELQYNSTELDLVPVLPGARVWATASSGSWGMAANWMPNQVPNGAGQMAEITAATTSSLTVALDSPVTVGELLLGNSASSTTGYTLSAGMSGTLTLDNSGSAAEILVSDGGHVISAPVILAGNLIVSPSLGSRLRSAATSARTPVGSSLTLSNSGTLVLSGSNTYSGGTLVDAGRLILTSNSAALGRVELDRRGRRGAGLRCGHRHGHGRIGPGCRSRAGHGTPAGGWFRARLDVLQEALPASLAGSFHSISIVNYD